MSRTYFDQSKFSMDLTKLAILEGKTGEEELKHQGKLLVRDLVKLTPPTGPSALSEGPDRQKKVGVAAVKRDIAKNWRAANSIVKKLEASNPHAAKSLSNYIRSGNIQAVQQMLMKLGWQNWNRVVLSVSEADHDKNRSRSTGRAIGILTMVLRSNTISQLARTKVAKVGTAKGGWETPAKALGAELPAWVLGHGTPGIYDPQLQGGKKSITLGNLVEYGGHLVPTRLINNALKIRQRSIEQRIAYKLKASVH